MNANRADTRGRSKWARRLAIALGVATLLLLAFAELFPYQAGLADPPPSPAALVGEVREALARQDVRTALAAWDAARVIAGRGRRWEVLIELGDAYLEIGDRTDFRRAFVPRARDTYLAALDLARRDASADGVVGAVRALAALDGDRPITTLPVNRAVLHATEHHGGQR